MFTFLAFEAGGTGPNAVADDDDDDDVDAVDDAVARRWTIDLEYGYTEEARHL